MNVCKHGNIYGRCPDCTDQEKHEHRTLDPDVKKGVDRPPEAKTMIVVVVTFRRGEGCCAEDPVRLVTAYYSSDGELLAEADPARNRG